MKNIISGRLQLNLKVAIYNYFKTLPNSLRAEVNFVNRKTVILHSLVKVKLITMSAGVILTFLISSSLIYGQINSPNNYPIINNLRFVSETYKSDNNSVYKAEKSKELISDLEHIVFDILNQKRVEAKLLPVKWNEEVAKIARLHSEDMAKNNYFSNTAPSGTTVTDRANLSKFLNWQEISQIIALNQGNKKPAEAACKGWLDTPSFSQNILNKKWTDAGVGIAVSSDDTYYFTKVFILK